jgi:hypothetical protein
MNAKKLLFWVVIVFLGFWLVTDPNGLADSASSGGGNVADVAEKLFRGVIDFLGALGD